MIVAQTAPSGNTPWLYETAATVIALLLAVCAYHRISLKKERPLRVPTGQLISVRGHSMSGLEALYWAQQYPDEVRTIVGLDSGTAESGR